MPVDGQYSACKRYSLSRVRKRTDGKFFLKLVSVKIRLILNSIYSIVLIVTFILRKTDRFHEVLTVFGFITYPCIRCCVLRKKRPVMKLSQKLSTIKLYHFCILLLSELECTMIKSPYHSSKKVCFLIDWLQ